MAQALRVLHVLENSLLISALITMLSLAVLQIVMRNFFDSGFLWAESFLRILVLWVAMLGALVATREGNHISIDALSRFLPASGKKAAQMLSHLLAASICGAVAWYSIEFVGYEYEDATIAFASVPTWICQSILPIGFAGMSVRFVIGAFKDLIA